MPLCASWHKVAYDTEIYGTYYSYIHRLIYQLFEVVYCPIAAIVMFAVSLLAMIVNRANSLHWPKVAFAAGMGPLGFGFLRMILAGSYSRNMVWFNFWEEVTELLFILGVCCILWIFRKGLFPEQNYKKTQVPK